MDGMRDKLKAVQDQLREVRAQIPAAEREVEAAKEAFANKEDLQADVKITQTKEFLDAQEAIKRAGLLKDQANDLEQAEKAIVTMMGDRQVARPDGLRGGAATARPPVAGWNARAMIDNSDAYNQAREAGIFRSEAKFGTLILGQVADRDTAMQFIASGGVRGGGGMQADAYGPIPDATPGPYSTPSTGIMPDFRGIIPYRVRPLTLLDLIPTGTTDSNTIEYVQVSAIPAGAVETAELTAKPQVGFATEDATAPVRTIAAWIKMSRQSMDDQAGVVSIINALLPYEVRRRIEAQILAGDGVGQNIRGILNTTGIGAPAAVAGDNAADAVLRAMTVVMLSDRDPNFVAMNPVTWQNLLLTKSTMGTYVFGDQGDTIGGPDLNGYQRPSAGGVGGFGGQTIWGLTMTPSRIVGQYNPLVGDSTGATILVREGVNVKTSDSDQDDFIKNRVTLLAETRMAFPVWYPTAFCEANIPT